MAFVVQGRIEVDSTGAVKSLSLTKEELEKLGGSADQAAYELDQAMAALRRKQRAQEKARGVGGPLTQTYQNQAGALSNLTAQWNDLAVMIAAGQNPVQLALQQGTQITQVIGPMGAAGAVKALTTSFLGLINPVSLVTLGTIAGSAALFQWARGAFQAAEDGEDFEEVLARIKEESDKAASSVRQFFAGAESAEELAIMDRVDELIRERERLLSSDFTRLSGLTNEINLEAIDEELDLLQSRLAVLRQTRAELEQVEEIKDNARQRERDQVTTSEILASLRDRRDLQAAINEFGKDSAEVRQAEARIERRLLEERINSLNVSQSLKDEILATLRAAQALEAADPARGIEEAADAARGLVLSLVEAKSLLASIGSEAATSQRRALAQAQVRAETVGDPVGRAEALAREDFNERTG